jgi:hypothetical protein
MLLKYHDLLETAICKLFRATGFGRFFLLDSKNTAYKFQNFLKTVIIGQILDLSLIQDY